MPMAPRAVAAIAGAIGSIHGVHLTDAAVRIRTGAGGLQHSYELSTTGWSPSLHSIRMIWKGVLPTDPSDPALAEAVMKACGRRIERQRARAARALDLGMALPQRFNYSRTVDVDHVHIDRAAAAHIIEHLSLSVLRLSLRDRLSSLHRDKATSDGGASMNDGATAISDASGDCIATFSTLFTDVGLVVNDLHLPETVAQAASGRRFGDVVDMPARFASRILQAVHVAPHGITFDMTPETLPLSAFDGLTGADELLALADATIPSSRSRP